MTETELILSLCKEKDLGVDGSNEDKLRKFRDTYKDQGDLITKAAQGDPKALRRLRWVFGLKVITDTNVGQKRDDIHHNLSMLRKSSAALAS